MRASRPTPLRNPLANARNPPPKKTAVPNVRRPDGAIGVAATAVVGTGVREIGEAVIGTGVKVGPRATGVPVKKLLPRWGAMFPRPLRLP